MRAVVPCWGSLAVIALVALTVRSADLARRPMHADEANQAVKAGELLESGRYVFDPRDHHGPTLYYAALPVAWLRGQRTLAALDETSVRLVPALAGTLAVLLLAMLAWPAAQNPADGTNRWPALAAAAFLAVSPPAVYYSRYFVQETLLLAFTLGAFVCTQRWWRTGLARWAVATGVCAGLMAATKASAPLFVFAALAALAFVRPRPAAPPRLARDVLLAAGAALGVAALSYSSFGANPGGLRDSLAALGHAWSRVTGGTGHEKPWWYYLRLFTWQRTGGLVWEQLAFSGLALAGLVAAFVSGNRLTRWAAGYTVIIVVVLSLTPYKTPWHAIHLVPGLALLAAGALAAFPGRWLAPAAAAVTLALLANQTWRASFLRPADERNPYAYVHSSPDVLKYRALAGAALARTPLAPVRVIGEEYWPLPWYLRGLPRIGYWNTPPESCDGALVIATVAQSAAVRGRLHGAYRETYLGLRPGVLCTVFTPEP
ncbi:MAG: TIGR03663 family protein [Opitutae bacterium]|nr:TIGR03663 family protein [Opitutae bacterium]